MPSFNPSRRTFLKTSVVAGVSVCIVPLADKAALAALFEDKRMTPVQTDPATGAPRFRVDGIAKVTGQKVFARDIRARDMAHWPAQQSHAFIVRATRADRAFAGVDLGLLGDDLKPDVVVTAAELERDGVSFPKFYGDDMLLPVGKTPAYLGHAVAILIYHDFARFRFAKDKLKFQDGIVRYGAETGALERDPWGTFRFVRVGGATPFDDDVFSSLKNAPVFPSGMRKHLPVWPDGKDHGQLGEQGMAHAGKIRDELAKPPANWLVLDREYHTQSIDTAALEPDNANCWYDRDSQTLHLVVPTQSPSEVGESAAELLAHCKAAFPVKTVVLHPTYTVGYGSKDHYNFPFYGLVTALYADGKPVRLANDRYEQFQTSIKRHAFTMRYRIGVDRETGLFQSFQGDLECNGGGRMNFSPSVAMVGATAAQSIYYFPKNDLTAVAIASRAIDAGSARGYGTLQSMAATEMMVDEFAEQLKLDPIDFRLKNALRSGMKNTQGAIPAGAIRVDEVLDAARKHPLWTGRASKKAAYEAANPGHRYGVGFACVQKDFGTGAETSFARVEIDADGKISLHHSGAEIGTGMSTSQAVALSRWLGRPATQVHTSVTDWPDLPVVTSGDPYLMSQAEQDKLAQNPRWSPGYASPASATNSAYYFTHSTREAARVVFMHGLWPAAMAIWSQGIGGGQATSLVVRVEDARWVDGKLSAGGLQALPFDQIVRKAHELGLVTGATVHVFNRWQWTEADFVVNGQAVRLPVDGLSVRLGGGKAEGKGTAHGYDVLDRRKVYIAPVQRNNAAVTYYSAVGTLVELSVHDASGKVSVLKHHSIMECGTQISPDLVSGQLQGGIAMGIGHALHEYLPLYEDGPGNGTWNFNRYHLPRASDVAVWTQTGTVLPPVTETDPPKGIAEVVMIPVVGAIVNGIAHAIGHRFTDLPVTPAKIQEVLA
ncbi:MULTISPECIES: molybdopterin cofactor-binding domain-containing protein [unclassified Cupriavidus]|uniref:xanthine dehydrogenase family protein molybdopterin-binding subunit n=1 Tax=unclassified Cupriavidus TaxID=2640874 RepID=UPI001C002A2A|nr:MULTISPECIES: molybdopterin cofactor-binding domain-containing protein [unclassified Cupriavidus]MCA3187003.1 xanthine dehydrogenase family protein molybdopterin-binding subunit [Cupriavidus sp.]MCA3189733.1 xanthine dehydrogenase family protein molybdopterin-binding subunit [Cupriavidus sp.]MCA3196327.1 xanthine dehydrogenase family protein molybdopterin-binding subunit [Cupriavidus sp.]MCA3202072.1 xanthine dehydrogenase family protein molybdopterin-binding subunit [Cupriavidus sp.]MCA320